MSQRTKQIESLLKRTVSQVLQRQIADPRIEGMISITRVQVSPDLHDAYVYFSVLPKDKQSKTLHGLRSASGHIHRLVKKQVALRVVPHLEFRLDESLKKEASVFDAIREAAARTGMELSETEDEDNPGNDEAGDGTEQSPGE